MMPAGPGRRAPGTRVALAVALLATAFAGCGLGETSSPSPTAIAAAPTASPTPSPTSSPTPPPSATPGPTPAPSASPSPSPAPSVSSLPAGPPTRVAVPYLDIDLPVVPPPRQSTFPRCDVAEYFRKPVFQHPGEGGVTYIYAHARSGMFLPILVESQRRDGGALIGREVRVWTDEGRRYTYEITAVRRHQKSLDWAYRLAPDSLVLQTSEGPSRDGPKVMLVASQVGDPVAVPHDEAHPSARPVVCR